MSKATKIVQVYSLDRREDPNGILLGVDFLRGAHHRVHRARSWQARRVIQAIGRKAIVTTALGRLYVTALIRVEETS